MSSKKPLVATTYNTVKEGIDYMETKHNVVKEGITPPIAKNEIETVNKTDKPQTYKSKNDKSISNKSEKSSSLDK